MSNKNEKSSFRKGFSTIENPQTLPILIIRAYACVYMREKICKNKLYREKRIKTSKQNLTLRKNNKGRKEVKLKMAGMKSWLEKIKNRILKKDLDDDLLESKIQSEEIENKKLKENELPDLITPTNEEINEIQREEAMRVNEMYEVEKTKENKKLHTCSANSVTKDFVHFTDVPKRTNPSRKWAEMLV